MFLHEHGESATSIHAFRSDICIQGGKFDNGGRFDLRLPYANQGYEDPDADVMAKIGNFFGGGKKKEVPPPEPEPEPVKKNKWPWEK